MEIKKSENLSVAGKVRITKYRAGTKEILWQSPWMPNLIVNGSGYGKNLIVQRLIGDTTYSLSITHGEIGTAIGTPLTTDVSLGYPIARTTVTLASVGATLNIAAIQFFFSDSQLSNRIYNEFGTFIDGGSGTGTGRMFNHILFSPAYTKNAGEDTTVEVDFTIS